MALNLNATTPAAPANNTNVTWQTDGSGNASAYAPTAPNRFTANDINLTAQSAAIAATNLIASAPASGAYRISWSSDITTADAVSSTLGGANGFQILYTSPTDSVVKTTIAQADWTSTANTTGTAVGGVAVIFAKTTTAIQYSFGYTSNTPGQMVYELHIRIEAI
jgi:hypothetical protein